MKKEVKIKKLIKQHGQLYSEELGIKLQTKKESELFKWFLASILFGARISETIAKNTYRVFVKRNILTPRAIQKASWRTMINIMGKGGYARYDGRTTTKLKEITKKLIQDYKGKLSVLHEKAYDARDLELKFQEFYGVGPITTNIFLRELRHVWKKANPEPLPIIKRLARKFKIKLPKNYKTKEFVRLEAAFIRLRKERK